ncbi:MAG: acyltransferase [Burkholderiales bacterium]
MAATEAAAGAAPSAGARGRYDALDGIRGFAVLLVFCVHAAGNGAAVALGVDFERAHFTALPTVGERALFWLYASHHGVFLFFVLSGFLIGRMWWPRPAMPYATFAWRRTLRIYPAFALAFVASLAFAYASGTWTPPDLARVAGNALFLNGLPGGSVVPFNIVTWSLFYEMTFYLAFPAFALAAVALGPRAGSALWAIPLGATLVAVARGADGLVLCWALLFAGVALAVHEAPVRALAARLPAGAVLGVYVAVTTAALFETMPPAPAIVAFGAATVMLVAKSLAPGNAVAWLFLRRPLRALGRISYSFYLVHWMLVVLAARAVAGHVGALGAFGAIVAVFVAGFAASAVAGTALWWVAERPYFARFAAGRPSGVPNRRE